MRPAGPTVRGEAEVKVHVLGTRKDGVRVPLLVGLDDRLVRRARIVERRSALDGLSATWSPSANIEVSYLHVEREGTANDLDASHEPRQEAALLVRRERHKVLIDRC